MENTHSAAWNPECERRLVQRAQEEGLLTLAEVEERTRAIHEWGPRLATLIDAGLLSPTRAIQLIQEVSADAEPVRSPAARAEPSPAALGAGPASARSR